MPGYDPEPPPRISDEEREESRMKTDQLLRLLPYYDKGTACSKCGFDSLTTDLVRALAFGGHLTQDCPGAYLIAKGPRVDVILRKCPNCGGHVLQKPLDYPGVTL